MSRDKRGYDLIYLIWDQRRRGRPEPRLLYCCRLPAPLRVGPPPFDEEVRKRLEEAYPEIPFDWATLLKSLLGAVSSTPRPTDPPHAGYRDRGARRNGAPPVTVASNGHSTSNGHSRHERGGDRPDRFDRGERGGDRASADRGSERSGERGSGRFGSAAGAGVSAYGAGATHNAANGRGSSSRGRSGAPAGGYAGTDFGRHRPAASTESHAFPSEPELHPEFHAELQLHPDLHHDTPHDEASHDELADAPQAEPVWPGLSDDLLDAASHEGTVVHLELPVPLASADDDVVELHHDDVIITEQVVVEAVSTETIVLAADAAVDEADEDEVDGDEESPDFAAGQTAEQGEDAASNDRARRRRRRRRGGRSRGPGPVPE